MSGPPLRRSRHHGTPQPIRKLLYRRVEVRCHETDGTVTGSSGWLETKYDARKWADRTHSDAPLVEITVFENSDAEQPEWRATERQERRNGQWTECL